MNIGENIKKYRKESGLTQKELADKLGISERTIQKYEANKVELTIKKIAMVASILDISADELMGKLQVKSIMEEYENELAQFLKIKEEELMLAMRYSKYSEINQTKEFLRGVVSGLNIAFDILKEEKSDDKSRKDF